MHLSVERVVSRIQAIVAEQCVASAQRLAAVLSELPSLHDVVAHPVLSPSLSLKWRCIDCKLLIFTRELFSLD